MALLVDTCLHAGAGVVGDVLEWVPEAEREMRMSKLRLRITMSLDGYVAGPGQDVENPLGSGGLELHEWFFPLKGFRAMHSEEGGDVNASSAVVEERLANVGATIMGRHMFGPVRGPWSDEPWRGWWGENPPFHHPVFVLTNHPREPLQMQGGASFRFVSNQYLAAGLIDEIDISIAPLSLGNGERLFAGLDHGTLKLKQIRAVEAPGVTHIKYEVG